MYVKNGVGRLKKVLLSKPEFLKAAKINEIAKKWDLDLDIPKMMKEHELFAETYRKL
jgi:N-dimethylarginine dimethylaminohydrolase